MRSLAGIVSCLDGYDPEALHVERARAAILACVEPLTGTERVPVRSALGRVLAEDVTSPFDVPAHRNSAMDGWAVRACDLAPDRETRLREIGAALAGRAFRGVVGPGESVRVMTGAVMPEGTDTVIVQEAVRSEGDYVVVPAGQKAGQNVREAGEDIRKGSVALAAGTLVRPAQLGLLGSLGRVEVAVRRRPRVAFFSTGDELTSAGETLAPGQVYDSNRYTIYGMLARLGFDLLDLGVVRDAPAALEAALANAAANADAIVTSGGVSVGEADFVRPLMARLGEVLFWKIAMRPGRPMAFGRAQGAWLFGLPGNPVAVMVTFYEFVRPALLRLAGVAGEATLPALRVPAAHAMRKIPGRTEYQRGVLYRDDGQWRARLTGQQGSGILRSMAEANCLIVLEHERGPVAPGEPVGVRLFEGLV